MVQLRRLQLVLAACVSAALFVTLASAANQADVQGTWPTTFIGANLYLCAEPIAGGNDLRVSGAFTEAGAVRGTAVDGPGSNEVTITGVWMLAGSYADTPQCLKDADDCCTYQSNAGAFEWTLNTQTNSITGSRWNDFDTSGAADADWNMDRASALVNDLECRPTDASLSTTMAGSWLDGAGNRMDICLLSDGKLVGSYDIGGLGPGYLSGRWYDSEPEIAHALWMEEILEGDEPTPEQWGSQLFVHQEDDSLWVWWWLNDPIVSGIVDVGLHGSELWSRVAGTPTEAECRRHEQGNLDDVCLYLENDQGEDSAAASLHASALVATFAAIAVVVLVGF